MECRQAAPIKNMNEQLQQVIDMLLKIKAIEDSETLSRVGSHLAIDMAVDILKRQQEVNSWLIKLKQLD